MAASNGSALRITTIEGHVRRFPDVSAAIDAGFIRTTDFRGLRMRQRACSIAFWMVQIILYCAMPRPIVF